MLSLALLEPYNLQFAPEIPNLELELEHVPQWSRFLVLRLMVRRLTYLHDDSTDDTYDDFRCEISNFFDRGWVRRNVCE